MLYSGLDQERFVTDQGLIGWTIPLELEKYPATGKSPSTSVVDSCRQSARILPTRRDSHVLHDRSSMGFSRGGVFLQLQRIVQPIELLVRDEPFLVEARVQPFWSTKATAHLAWRRRHRSGSYARLHGATFDTSG